MICERCKKVIDHAAIGAEMREKRLSAGKSLREIGAKISTAKKKSLTVGYICDLEKGRRNWSEELKSKYLAAVRG